MPKAKLVEIGPHYIDETTIPLKILYKPKHDFKMINMYLSKVKFKSFYLPSHDG